MPLNSLHFMSHIVAPHLQNFFTVCYLWAAWGNCAFSSWQAQRFHPVYVVATWASTSMCCILMAVSEPSMYKTCIIALMSPLAGVFCCLSWTYFNRYLAGVQNPNPNLSHHGMRACKHGEETGQELQWKCSELSRTVSYRFFSPLSRFFSPLSHFRTVAYGVVFLLASSFFDLFGSGQASVTRKLRAIPFYPSWVRTKDASKYPPWHVLA